MERLILDVAHGSKPLKGIEHTKRASPAPQNYNSPRPPSNLIQPWPLSYYANSTGSNTLAIQIPGSVADGFVTANNGTMAAYA